MPGRIRQATLVFLGPDDDWRNWCARALALNRLHPLVCPQRPKEPRKPGAALAKPAPKTPAEADPWPYPLMMVPADKVRERLLAMEAVAVVLHEGEGEESFRGLIDMLINVLGPNRVSMAVICEQRDSPWLKDDLLDRIPVTITLLSRRGDNLTLLRRVRRAPEEKRRRSGSPPTPQQE